MKIKDLITRLESEAAWLRKQQQQLESLSDDVVGEFWLNQFFDFNCLSHENVVKVMIAFGGNWNKQVQEDRINYSRATELDGVTVRCYMGEPPPACKIVEVEEDVPARPAGKQKVRKLVCPDGMT